MPPSETGSSSRPRSRLWGELTREVVPFGTAICLLRDASENLSEATRQQVYSKSEYRQDCALLLLLHHKRERYADMVTYISEYDLAEAVGVWRVGQRRGNRIYKPGPRPNFTDSKVELQILELSSSGSTASGRGLRP